MFPGGSDGGGGSGGSSGRRDKVAATGEARGRRPAPESLAPQGPVSNNKGNDDAQDAERQRHPELLALPGSGFLLVCQQLQEQLLDG